MQQKLKITACLVFLIFLCSNVMASGNWRRGKKEYKAVCMKCHTRDGKAKRLKLNKIRVEYWPKFFSADVEHKAVLQTFNDQQKIDIKKYLSKFSLGYVPKELTAQERADVLARQNQRTELRIQELRKQNLKKCEQGIAESCRKLGEGYRDFERIEDSVIYYKKACNLNDGNSCRNLACVFDDRKDHKQSIAYDTKGCDLDYLGSCHELAVKYRNGNVVKEDDLKSFKFSSKMCKLGSAVGCSDAGYMYYAGHGVKKDYLKARAYYGKACAMLKDPKSADCINYNRFLEVERD